MADLRTLLKTHWLTTCVAAAAVGGLVLFANWMTTSDTNTLTSDVNEQVWIDIDGVSFKHTLKAFDATPVVGPTGKPAFRAEMCYWTRDGKTKPVPTPVLLNTHRGLPEPTYCPDCDRLVVPLNPAPLETADGQPPRAPQQRPAAN